MRISTIVAFGIVASALLAQTKPANSQATDGSAAPTPTQQSTTAVVLQASMQAAIPAGCSQMVLGLVPKFKEFGFIDMTKMSDFACRCATERFMADGRFQELLKLNDDELKAIMNAPNFKQFFGAKVASAVLVCIGTQINEQTNNANLTF